MNSHGCQVAAGSVAGWRHVTAGRPNQDAFYWAEADGSLVAVVCDGCGSSRHSEIGAHLGARLATRALLSRLTDLSARGIRLGDATSIQPVLDGTRRAVLHRLRTVASSLGDDLTLVVCDYLLFTVVGLAITSDVAFAFGVGDGIVSLNGAVSVLGPFAENAPPYFAYGLLDRCAGASSDRTSALTLVRSMAAEEFRTAGIGTDGTRPLLATFSESEPESDWFSHRASNDRVFTNPDSLRRELAQLSREDTGIDWVERRVIRRRGILDDDTTVVVVRRDPAASGAR